MRAGSIALRLSRIAILGPGLIGGSLALAIRRRELCPRLSLWSRDARERDAICANGVAKEHDLVTDNPAAAVAGADLVMLCVPPDAMVDLARRIAPHLEPGAVVSDVASVKNGLATELGAIFQTPAEDAARPATAAIGSRYVGAHPMAGGERGGPDAARADLFENTVCLLTPDDGTAPDALARVESFWRALGSRVRCLTPAAHDEAVALVSHLPHLLAAALVNHVAAQPGEPVACAGPGWRDATRIAAGSPELWTEILSRNRLPVTNALNGLITRLGEAARFLETGREAELRIFLSEAKCQREMLAGG